MTHNHTTHVVTCDAPACTFRLYTMGGPPDTRWAAHGGTTHPDGTHTCPHHPTPTGDTTP